jgi:hypothetical protein
MYTILEGANGNFAYYYLQKIFDVEKMLKL